MWLCVQCRIVFVCYRSKTKEKKNRAIQLAGWMEISTGAAAIHFNWCRKFCSLLISKIKVTFRSLSLAYFSMLCSQYENNVRLLVAFFLFSSFYFLPFFHVCSIFRQSLSPCLHWHAWRLHIYIRNWLSVSLANRWNKILILLMRNGVLVYRD